jgi:predicted HTH transcriptional regulator
VHCSARNSFYRYATFHLAEPFDFIRYIKKAGSGILDMIALCREARLAKPEFRQDGGQFVQTLWRPVTKPLPASIMANGTKSAPS